MRIRLIVLLCLLSLSLKAQQISFDQIINFPVSGLKNPWVGGFNSVQFFSIDLDEDGKQDLVVFDRSSQHLKTFLKNAYGGFTYSPGYQKRFPLIENWMNLLDYDGDGDKDLFTSTPGGIQVYPNLNNYFPKSLGTLKSTGLNGLINIYVSTSDIPAIADMDGDGDLDILAFESAGHLITYYENTGDLKYVTKSQNWGNFLLNDCQDIAFNVVPESVLSTQSTAAVQHAGNTLALWDQDKNGIYDLIIGHVGCPGFIFMKNEGTRDKPKFRNADYNFPAGAPHTVPSLASGSPIDLDGDGFLDLIASSHLPDLNPALETVSYYRSENGALVLKTKAFLQEEMIDVGDNASPVFYDVEGDGDLDLLIGSGSVTFYENVNGTLSFKSRDFLPLTGASGIQLQVVNSRLMLYYLKGSAVYYRVYSGGQLGEEKALNVVSLRETPRLYDINQDGSLELVVLDYLGGTRVYDWSDLSKPYQRIETAFRGIAYADITGDGNAEQITIDASGYLYVSGLGIEVQRLPFQVGQNAQISTADFNRDGKIDIVVGLASGGVQLFQNTSDIIIPSDELYVWPNPASSLVNIRVKNTGTLQWFDLSGRVLGGEISVNAGETLRIPAPLPGAGNYLLKYDSAKGSVTQKVLILP
ncbi:MAG: hypothetical protein RL422_1725 [Bacteroidota bacterium]|jgi:hypothetical protein